ncbi:UDP-N-acetylmuramoyl-tripeptide--D-alanyl-D-alanine ligase [Luteimonas vadosa]|uniref:UDP-N-acetylmuramoyl-tripeptide--D-alanyl-D-alanine ligase n=1 Tax=Luteimonas vadosa TaxID=1165507 RepID=A0ABP9DUR9_9GAMM
MKPVALSRIADWTGGRVEAASGVAGDVLIDAVSTDTRTLDARDGRAALFVALAGERFDGHEHVGDAARLGARAALVSRVVDAPLPQVVVGDPERALGALAAALQRGRRTRVLAVTGSNGKTSVKQLLLSILGKAGRAHANPGNLNNEIGLPLAVIDAPEDADFAVYEMGAGKPGDIAYLTSIARPDVSLVNNVAPAHLERLGSLQGVAETKGAIHDALPADGVAVVNADDGFAAQFEARVLAGHPGRRIIRFGIDANADVTARRISFGEEGSEFELSTPSGVAAVELPLAGRHNVSNALAAASMAIACGVGLDAIVDGLRDMRPVAGRLVRHHLANGAWLIDDSYNANPASLSAAIDTLAAMAGENWLVLGDMRELGADAEALHAEAGRHAKSAGISRLYALGPLSARAAEAFGDGGRHFATHEALAEAVRQDIHAMVRVVVKGSRGSAMERVVAALLAHGSGKGGNAHVA